MVAIVRGTRFKAMLMIFVALLATAVVYDCAVSVNLKIDEWLGVERCITHDGKWDDRGFVCNTLLGSRASRRNSFCYDYGRLWNMPRNHCEGARNELFQKCNENYGEWDGNKMECRSFETDRRCGSEGRRWNPKEMVCQEIE